MVLTQLDKTQVLLVEKDNDCRSEAWRLDSVKGVPWDDFEKIVKFFFNNCLSTTQKDGAEHHPTELQNNTPNYFSTVIV